MTSAMTGADDTRRGRWKHRPLSTTRRQPETSSMDQSAAMRSVITVGAGRGFVVKGKRDRLIITAAHCLPHFPPCASFSDTSERTYQDLVGELDGETAVWAECLFVDPISDLAILGPPDNQEL